jgi:hypothetical protein
VAVNTGVIGQYKPIIPKSRPSTKQHLEQFDMQMKGDVMILENKRVRAEVGSITTITAREAGVNGIGKHGDVHLDEKDCIEIMGQICDILHPSATILKRANNVQQLREEIMFWRVLKRDIRLNIVEQCWKRLKDGYDVKAARKYGKNALAHFKYSIYNIVVAETSYVAKPGFGINSKNIIKYDSKRCIILIQKQLETPMKLFSQIRYMRSLYGHDRFPFITYSPFPIMNMSHTHMLTAKEITATARICDKINIMLICHKFGDPAHIIAEFTNGALCKFDIFKQKVTYGRNRYLRQCVAEYMIIFVRRDKSRLYAHFDGMYLHLHRCRGFGEIDYMLGYLLK